MSDRQRLTVVIVTWLRPDYVRSCLEHLALQDPPPDEVLVVDASDDDRTANAMKAFPGSRRIPFAGGAGHMTTSRNFGLLQATGEIIAFLDDDANARAGWCENLRATFADPAIAAVAGRTCNGVPGETVEGLDAIGRVFPNGALTGNFAADPGRIVDVEHGIGANMSFRRAALARLGGFRDDFAGTGVREDADMFLRLRALGYRVVFVPGACVDHVGAPHVRGRRFDFRYEFWARRNHALLIARNFGIGSPRFAGWLWHELRHPYLGEGTRARRALREALALVGTSAGLATVLVKARWRATAPERVDATGDELRAWLASPGGDGA